MNLTTRIVPSTVLRAALGTDAAVSAASGLAQLAGGIGLASALGLPAPLLQHTGAFFLAYAALLVVLATRPHLHAAWAGFVAAGNLGWALACLAVWAFGVLAPTLAGAAWLAAQALATALFAAWQFAGIRSSAPAAASSFGWRHA